MPMSWYGFAPYVPVAERRRKATKEVEKLKKKGQICQPVWIEGRSIADTFWGKAWCKNLESYSDYSNRLPRGRSYVRNGFVIDLHVTKGEITAKVYGSSIYTVKIAIDKVPATKWKDMVSACAGKIESMIELLQGKFSKAVMQIVTDPKTGLFPHPKEINLSCSCPDWTEMCKHVAAVLYGVGARLDSKPEELFLLLQADYDELISKATARSLTQISSDQSDQILDDSDLSSLFGIDMGDAAQQEVINSPRKVLKGKATKRKVLKGKALKKKKTLGKTSNVRNKKSKAAVIKAVKKKKISSATKKKDRSAKAKKVISKKRNK